MPPSMVMVVLKAWQLEFAKRDLANLMIGIEAINKQADARKVKFFERMNAMNERELLARKAVLLNAHANILPIEATTMMQMMETGVFKVKATTGDVCLSGDDLDGGDKGFLQAGFQDEESRRRFGWKSAGHFHVSEHSTNASSALYLPSRTQQLRLSLCSVRLISLFRW